MRTGHELGPPKTPCTPPFTDLVDWSDGLSEQEAIALGLWNSPAYQELLADLQIAQADIIQAGQLQNPQVVTMFPVGPKQWEFALMLPLDVLWLRPLRVSAAQLESQRVADRLVQDGLDVVRDIRVAYMDWQLTVQRAQLARDAAELQSEVARIAEARLAAGDVAELDIAPIRLDALVGRGEVARADRDAELARERLRYLLGLQQSNIPLLPARMLEPQWIDYEIEQLVDEAVSSRPDLRAIRMAVSAAQQRAALARRDIWQLAGALPDINSRGRKGFEAGPGLLVTVPLFHQNQGAVAQASANAARLRQQYENRRDLSAMEVKQAYTRLLQAKQEREIWRDQILPQTREAVIIARKALEEDVVSPLAVLETTRQFVAAQQREREAEAQLRRAVAELERSVGRRLFPAPDEPADAEILPVPQIEAGENGR